MSFSEELLPALESCVGPKGVLSDPKDLAAYSTDWRGLFHGRPACVVRPASTGEVSAVMRSCHKAGAVVVPQGGNTGLAGAATPDDSGTQVILSLERMTAIRRIDPVGLTVEVEAGAILQTVKEAVAAEGRLLPVSLAAEGSAHIGGIISTNAGGLDVLRYGMTRGLTLGLEVVLPDGRVIDRLKHLRKDNAGYDLKQLFIGTEGTLGIITAAVLRLVPFPRHRVTALIAVPDIESAISIFNHAQSEIGEALSAFELISGEGLKLVERHKGQSAPVASSDWVLLIEAASSLPGVVAAAEALLETAFEAGLALDGVVANSISQANAIWALREGLTEAEAQEGPSLKHDISVPITAIPDFLADAGRVLADLAPTARLNVFGHLGDGNLHYNVWQGNDDLPEQIMRVVHDAVVRHGGSISAEHGLGQYRVSEWARLTDADDQDLAAAIKQMLDPDGLLNPGKGLPVRSRKARS